MKTCIEKKFTQATDCCGSDEVENEITITAEDGGGGTYVVLKSTRWAMDSNEEIDALCKELKEMLKTEDIWGLRDKKKKDRKT